MKLFRWGGVGVLAVLCACGGSSSGGTGNGGNGGTGSGPLLSVTVTGGGTVTSADGIINCTASCSQAEKAGAAVHLDATPAAGMQFMGWSGACSGTGSCDLTVNADTAVGAAFSPTGAAATVPVEVELDGAGTGSVVSTPAGINCPGTCLMQIAPGTVVTLTGTAGANSHFEGFGGSTCNGLACNFTVSGAAKIFANFSSTTITATHTLTVTKTGDGTVVSSPAGISCPGACAAPFQEGATVVLTATAASGSTFSGWSGACTGTGGCSISLGANAAVTATFATAPADACAGLLPTLPAPKTASGGVTGASATACTSATSDGSGIVYVQAGADGASSVTSTNPANAQDTHEISDVFVISPLTSGFTGTPFLATGPSRSIAYAPDGTIASTVLLPGHDGSVQTRGLNAGGGSIVLTVTGQTTCDLDFLRLDDANKVTSETTASDACANGNLLFSVMVDLTGNTLVVVPIKGSALTGVPVGHFAARWFDATSKALTDWFDAGAIPASSSTAMLRPLIGGGAALRAGDNWIATLPSGKASPAAAPAGFEALHDAVIARGGKAYAMIPDANTAGSVDIVAPAGKSCGALTSDANADFFAGKDGTLIKLGGASNCSATYYSQALK